MWDAIVGFVKNLFGSKGGTTQLGAGNQAVSGVTVGDHADGVTIAKEVTHHHHGGGPHSEAVDFGWLEATMPGLLAEMKADLTARPLDREFVVLPTKGVVFNGNALRYHGNEHEHLAGMMSVLENLGLIRDITFNNTKRYRMSEEFARYLAKAPANPGG